VSAALLFGGLREWFMAQRLARRVLLMGGMPRTGR
jgi:hypothetical protein